MNKKLKRLNLVLASVSCGALLGGAIATLPRAYTAAAQSYSPTSVFTRGGDATVGAYESDATALAFKFAKDGDKVSYNRDLAWKWHTVGNDAECLNFAFVLDENFSQFTVTLETASLTATEHGKVTNSIVFVRESGALKVKLNDGAEVSLSANAIEVKLKEGTAVGEYDVLVNDATIGSIENVGSDYAAYSSGENGITPLKFEAKLANAETPSVCLISSLNGQSFALNGNKEIEDSAAPVLIVNDDSLTLSIGETFSLDTVVIDVLDKSPKSSVTYYQWAPVDAEAKYSSLSTSSTYFFDKKYTEGEGESAVQKSVYDQVFHGVSGREYVSIKYTLSDSTYKSGDEEKKPAETYLVWYMKSNVYSMDFSGGESRVDCLAVGEDNESPSYVGGLIEPGVVSAASNYQSKVTESAEGMQAGSSETFYLPSPEKLFEDNSTSYQSLKYTLCYKTPTNQTGSSSTNVSISNLKLTVSSVGTYQFKLFVTDRAGNVTKSKKTGDVEAEELTTSNIWEHDEIPTFSFKLDTFKKIYLDSDTVSSRSGTGLINVQYTDISFNVKGTPAKSTYGLYYLDIEQFNKSYPSNRLTKSDLSEIATSALRTANTVESAAQLYAEALAKKADSTGAVVTADTFLKENGGVTLLRRIDEYNDQVKDENYPDNRFKWNASDKKFTPVERGNYIVFGVFEDEHALSAAVAGYKAITVTDKEDINPGESEWLKNNLVSVILFSIAGVMLILIIILLFVKPSDETLEEVSEVAVKKGGKKKEKKGKESKK